MRISLHKTNQQISLTKGAVSVTIGENNTALDISKGSNNLSLEKTISQLELVEDNEDVSLTSNSSEVVNLSIVRNDIELVENRDAVALSRVESPISLESGTNNVSITVDTVVSQSPYGPQDIADAICSATDAVGDLVYASGVDVGGAYTVSKINIADENKMPAWAIIISKNGSTNCTVRFRGPLIGFVSGLTPGKPVFAGATGTLTQTVPTTVGRFVQFIGDAISDDIIILRPNFHMVRRA